MIREEQKQALLSYARSFLVAALTVYSTGDVSIKHMIYAGLVAVIAPAIRALNPNDPAFGRKADLFSADIAALLDDLKKTNAVKPKKKTAKKKAVKKK